MMKLFSQLSTDISIHALLAESDRCCPCAIIAPAISIHALLAESDLLPFAMTITALDFYPRSPCGERPKRYLPCCTSRIFLSTLSLRRATTQSIANLDDIMLSIHALLAESDCAQSLTKSARKAFLSTLSLRRATPATRLRRESNQFLSTLSLRRATLFTIGLNRAHGISIHALLAESDLNFHHRRPCCFQFLSTLSLRRATCARVWQH